MNTSNIQVSMDASTLGGIMSGIASIFSTLVGVATSVGVWGTGAHSLGLLPQEAFITAANFGIILPPMPR
ncbi:hypothetical protein ABIE38_000969 [Dietzia sp. 2505]|uniref:Uncharacterized protein n=2 Tax=Dietziaceae TaxID=85029 RepID=A0ABN2I0G1_9ACTN|nr:MULTISPECIES: hypothetical protein [Dietzia]MBB1042381.1 hypothetical protein [Dietzia sp. Cai40]MBB1043609.1 hypothetical protein [Dietzia sp. DQ11-44]MBB1048325.1 hypothetical protein [Dietzia cercidiphylli]MDZ4234649.1 hypothetical protein [Dietzia sp.]